MGIGFATIFFLALTLALLLLPFVPAFVEWRRKTDTEPLRVVKASEVNVRHFAQRFREYIEAHLGAVLEKCRKSGVTESGALKDGTPYVVVGADETSLLTPDEERDRAAHRVIVSGGDLNLPKGTMYLPEVYADGTIKGGEKNIYRAVLAEKSIELGKESMSLRWLHAARTIVAGTRSVLFGRVSADELIRLESGCRFERLHAPRIEFCDAADAGKTAGGKTYGKSAVLEAKDLPNRVEIKAGRWLVDGNAEIPAGKIVKTNLVVTGSLRIRSGTHVVGSIKSHKKMHLEKGVVVDGTVASERDIRFDGGCQIHGPVLAEGAIAIGEGVIFGSAARPTTVSAVNIVVEPGAVAHGTVRAHAEGKVTLSSSGRRSAPDAGTVGERA